MQEWGTPRSLGVGLNHLVSEWKEAEAGGL